MSSYSKLKDMSACPQPVRRSTEKQCEGGCQTQFQITDEDRQFYEKISPVIGGKKYLIPEPTLCPDCRQQRRLSFRNERNLYRRSCGRCQKSTISVYSPEKPFTVYCLDCWWGDDWSPLDYGQEFDFNRPFFEQYQELMLKVPLLANNVFNGVNCEYNSFCVDSKDCYLSSRVGASENILYSYLALQSRDSVDCYDLFSSEGCYECVDCWNCYDLYYSQLCKNSRDLIFCFDCIGSNNCFGCVGLRNKEYYFFNKPCAKEDYEKYVNEFFNGSFEKIDNIRKKIYDEVILKSPHQATYILNSENSVGNYIVESRDIRMGFDIEKTEGAAYTWGAEFSKDLLDTSFMYYAERCYEHISNSGSTDILFSFTAINGVRDMIYSMQCLNNSRYIFGCLGLTQKNYCILNKQYTADEYHHLVAKILEHMKETKEYGEFFPMNISFFDYNESIAQEYFPLKKEEVIQKGLAWKDENIHNDKPQNSTEIPDNIKDTTDQILEKTLICSVTGQPYKIIKKELDFYRAKNLPIPRIHPNERHRQRMISRNPRKLWKRNCFGCDKSILSSYAPERPEKIYCEECYLKEVY